MLRTSGSRLNIVFLRASKLGVTSSNCPLVIRTLAAEFLAKKFDLSWRVILGER
jgi:hypothetical protein